MEMTGRSLFLAFNFDLSEAFLRHSVADGSPSLEFGQRSPKSSLAGRY
jgi:hypothetical protein